MATKNAIDSNIPIEISKGGTNNTSLGTTDGVIYYDGSKLTTTSAGNSGEILTSNGAGVAPTYQAPSGGSNWVLISTQTASSSSLVSWTSGITTTYDRYTIIFDNVNVDTDAASIYMQISTDSGSTWKTTNYYSGGFATRRDVIAYTAPAAITSAFLISYIQKNNTDSPCSGQIMINAFSSSSNPCVTVFGTGNVTFTGTAYPTWACYAGVYTGAAAQFNAIKIYPTSGNLSTGTFSLYGILA